MVDFQFLSVHQPLFDVPTYFAVLLYDGIPELGALKIMRMFLFL